MTNQPSAKPAESEQSEIFISDADAITSRGLQQIANGSLILATLLLFLNLFSAIQSQNIISASIVLLLFLLTFFATFLRSFSHNLRAWLLVIAFLGTGIGSGITQGLSANSILYFFCAVVISALLHPRNRWHWILGASALFLVGLAILFGYHIINSVTIIPQSNALLTWISVITVMLFLAFLISSVVASVFSGFKNLIAEIRTNELEVKAKDASLTEQVTLLEKQLDRRNFRMVAARQIAREIAQQINYSVLLKDSVELVRSQFGYYYTGIFLKDERSEFAVLKAGTGEAGSEMLARKHQLRLREEGVVGYVVAKGEVRIASDVDLDAVHYKNPSLPFTRSEMAIPLRVGNQVIGALDVQSQNPSEFNNEDADVLQTVADTLATSIDKLNQIQSLKESLAALEEKNREFTSRTWQSHLKGSRKKLNFRYFGSQTQATEDRTHFFRETMTKGKPVITPLTSDEPGNTPGVMLSVPIKLRDQVLGVVNISYDGKNMPDEMLTLMNSASDRLALALENARLLEEIQERAEREHMVANISDKVRAASDIDAILKTTATELGKSLGVAEVRIQLKTAAVD